MTKTASRWFSSRIQQEISLVRWGHWGQPVLVFPTAGGDAEEIERMHLIGELTPLIKAGRIKVYSCDSLAGRALATKEGSEAYRCALLSAFEEFVAYEAVPAIRTDCRDSEIEIITAGASLGAFKATAMLCRYPWLFRAAIGMSGTYDLETLLGFRGTEDYYFAAPLAFLPNLDGSLLERLRQRFMLLAYGEGRWESPEEAWGFERILGAKGIPNRVDVWGPEWDHDWVTWRRMLPLYLDELTR